MITLKCVNRCRIYSRNERVNPEDDLRFLGSTPADRGHLNLNRSSPRNASLVRNIVSRIEGVSKVGRITATDDPRIRE